MPFTREGACVVGDIERQDDTEVVHVKHRLAIHVWSPVAKARSQDATIVLAVYQQGSLGNESQLATLTHPEWMMLLRTLYTSLASSRSMYWPFTVV